MLGVVLEKIELHLKNKNLKERGELK